MTIYETINAVYALYHTDTSVDNLTKAGIKLSEIIKDKYTNPENKEKAEALAVKLTAKIYAIKYFDGGYYEEDYEKLSSYISLTLPACSLAGWEKNVALLSSLDEITKVVHSVMKDAGDHVVAIRDENGECITDSRDLLLKVKSEFEAKIAIIEKLEDTSKLFGEKVKMLDIKAQTIKDLKEVCDWAKTAASKLNSKQAEYFFSTHSSLLDDEPGDKQFDFAPSLERGNAYTAGTVVLSSPFKDEIVLFTRAQAKINGLTFYLFNASAFSDKDESFIDTVFESLYYRKGSLLLFGLADYHDVNKAYLMEKILRSSKNGTTVFAVDNKGDGKVYSEFLSIAEKAEDLSIMDVSSKYLTMPSFKEVVNELEDREMITGADYDFFRKHLAFMGYVGFNRAIFLHSRQKPWRDDVLDISKAHESQIQIYLLNIPSQNQLIDYDWIDLSLKRNTDKPEKAFDYDSVRIANPANIKKILEASISIFAKCGLAARYSLLCGDDVSVWTTLSAEERTERLSLACKLVSHILSTVYTPSIQVIPNSEWDIKGAGAVCCQGGKLILFKESSCNDYDWSVTAVCHEVYHSLQHTVENGPWREWYWTELGITKNRIPEWRYNHEHYYNTSHPSYYNIEIIECDARAFENDCFQQSESAYKNIDWE